MTNEQMQSVIEQGQSRLLRDVRSCRVLMRGAALLHREHRKEGNIETSEQRLFQAKRLRDLSHQFQKETV